MIMAEIAYQFNGLLAPLNLVVRIIMLQNQLMPAVLTFKLFIGGNSFVSPAESAVHFSPLLAALKLVVRLVMLQKQLTPAILASILFKSG